MITDEARSVLIVEDERIVALDLQQILAGLGYDAFAVASSADEAIARASERCPDVVLMDIRINGKRDGIETAEILKRQFGVPVVFLTAHADEATIERAKKTEPQGYLLKPVKAAELRSAIEVCIHRHAMEKRLRHRERWFSTTLQSIADGVLTVDLAGKVTFMNPTAEALTGVKVSGATGKHAGDVFRLVRNDAMGEEDSPLAIALREKRAVELQASRLLNLATGAEAMIYESAAPVMDDDEQLGAVIVFRDVSEQQAMQQQLEVADRLASLGTMAAGVAHEINNPLAVIVGNAAYAMEELARHQAGLERAGLPAESAPHLGEAAKALSDIQSAASRIARIVGDLQAFSRPVHRSDGTVDVAQCIDWALRTTSHEFLNRAEVVARLSQVPAVRADEARLGQVLINLLVNAAHAIAPGNAGANRVTITLRPDSDGWIAVEVADTGSGIAPELLRRIFDPFFTTKAVGVGTGLGLSICRGIVHSLGGELSLESALGKGTQFLVRLPVASRAEVEPATVEPGPSPHLRGRILVVDDEEAVLRTFARVLRDHHVVCTVSGLEALRILERDEPFDIIFCDLMMAAMTGMAFYEALLGRNPGLARRVVFISGGVTTPRVTDFLQSVPNLRVDKPFTVTGLLDTVQKLLAAHSGPGPRRRPKY